MDWFKIIINDEKIIVNIETTGVNYEINWSEIIRVCFKSGDLFEQDEIYIFVKDQENSYLIPTEASGGSELWGEIIDRKLFDAKLAIQAATSNEGIFCWPEI